MLSEQGCRAERTDRIYALRALLPPGKRYGLKFYKIAGRHVGLRKKGAPGGECAGVAPHAVVFALGCKASEMAATRWPFFSELA